MNSRHLLNPLAPLNQPTPSQLDGVPEELERDLRACAFRVQPACKLRLTSPLQDGAILIQQAGVMLKAWVNSRRERAARADPPPPPPLPDPLRPQVVLATAQVLFQRFWFVTSMKHFGVRVRSPSPSPLVTSPR